MSPSASRASARRHNASALLGLVLQQRVEVAQGVSERAEPGGAAGGVEQPAGRLVGPITVQPVPGDQRRFGAGARQPACRVAVHRDTVVRGHLLGQCPAHQIVPEAVAALGDDERAGLQAGVEQRERVAARPGRSGPARRRRRGRHRPRRDGAAWRRWRRRGRGTAPSPSPTPTAARPASRRYRRRGPAPVRRTGCPARSRRSGPWPGRWGAAAHRPSPVPRRPRAPSGRDRWRRTGRPARGPRRRGPARRGPTPTGRPARPTAVERPRVRASWAHVSVVASSARWASSTTSRAPAGGRGGHEHPVHGADHHVPVQALLGRPRRAGQRGQSGEHGAGGAGNGVKEAPVPAEQVLHGGGKWGVRAVCRTPR